VPAVALLERQLRNFVRRDDECPDADRV